MIYNGKDHILYSDGKDTISVQVEQKYIEPHSTECASWPVIPDCSSYGWADLHGDKSPLISVESISITKTDNNWQCNEFQIGDSNGFLLNCNDHYELSPINNNKYTISVVSNYIFNHTNVGDVQEIVKQHPLGNVSELTRAVYQPEYGVLELTFSNPSDTWKQIP